MSNILNSVYLLFPFIPLYCLMWIIHFNVLEFLSVLQLHYVVLELRYVVL